MHRPFGRCPIGGRRPRWSAGPRLDSRAFETVANVGGYGVRLYEQVFGDLPVGLALWHSRCRTTASQSRRTRLCGRAAPWRPWRSSARRATAGILACSAPRIRSCRKASRSPGSARMPASTSFADRHYQLWNGQPAGSGELRDREPPPRPLSSDPFGRTGHSAQAGRHLFSPTRAAKRSSMRWPGPIRSPLCPLPRGHGRTRRMQTGCREPARLCAACADLTVLT